MFVILSRRYFDQEIIDLGKILWYFPDQVGMMEKGYYKMEQSAKQQASELVRKSTNVLILSHANPDGDALGSALGLHLALQKMGKNSTVAFSGEISKIFKFLPGYDQITSEISSNKDFVISLDLTNAEIDKMGYKKSDEEKKLNIVISPKVGQFTPEDVSFVMGSSNYDLIFVLDCSDLDLIGEIYDKNTALFYEIPVINIDHHGSNEYFGKINWIELTATSTAEVISGFVESLGRDNPLLDADIATCLLTGITTDTGSFQNTNTTPKSLTVSAQLVAAGAAQQDIVRFVFKTKPLTTLKLWGEILQNIHQEEDFGFVWSEVDAKTIQSVGASPIETSGAIDELKSIPNIKFALLLSERNGGIHGSFRATGKGFDVRALAKLFGGGGHEAAAAFELDNTQLRDSRDSIIAQIKEYLVKNA